MAAQISPSLSFISESLLSDFLDRFFSIGAGANDVFWTESGSAVIGLAVVNFGLVHAAAVKLHFVESCGAWRIAFREALEIDEPGVGRQP